MPATKASRRHSAADEAALKACRTHLVSANKALDDAGAPPHDPAASDVPALKALNYDQAARAVRDAWYAQHPDTGAPAKMPSYVESAYDNAVIVSDAGQLYRVPYRLDGERYYFADRTLWEPVRQTYVAEDGHEIKAVPGIAPDAHGGAMACFVTSQETQALLRGLLPAELRADSEADHLTIAYLTEDAESCADCKGALLRGLVAVAESGGPITGTLGGLARFPASETSDGMDVLVALFDAPGLDDLRVAVMDAACCAELDPPMEHGFIPHITLAYIDPAEPTPAITMGREPLTFDAITLVWAGERIDIPLSGEGDDYEAEDDGEGEGDMGDMGEQTTSAGRMLTEDDIQRGPPGMAHSPTAEVKMLDDGRLLVRGISYGACDLAGDTFTKSTDLGAARSFVGTPVYYDHAKYGIKSQIGQVVSYKATDDGIDFYVELNRHQKYIDTITRLYQKGALGGSTGAASHLVVREGGMLKRWIVAELSLTPTPCSPENLPGTQAPTKAAPEAPHGAAGGELARVLAATTNGFLAYRLRSRYGK
jgi:2'-5' RNA ligase